MAGMDKIIIGQGEYLVSNGVYFTLLGALIDSSADTAGKQGVAGKDHVRQDQPDGFMGVSGQFDNAHLDIAKRQGVVLFDAGNRYSRDRSGACIYGRLECVRDCRQFSGMIIMVVGDEYRLKA